MAARAPRPFLVGVWPLSGVLTWEDSGDLELGEIIEFGGIESPRIWGPVWVPELVWQARARGHDLVRPPGAPPDLLVPRARAWYRKNQVTREAEEGQGKILGSSYPQCSRLYGDTEDKTHPR